jgi:hypothetical protein
MNRRSKEVFSLAGFLGNGRLVDAATGLRPSPKAHSKNTSYKIGRAVATRKIKEKGSRAQQAKTPFLSGC